MPWSLFSQSGVLMLCPLTCLSLLPSLSLSLPTADVVVNEPMTELLHAVLQIMLIIRKKGVYEGIFSSNAAIEVST